MYFLWAFNSLIYVLTMRGSGVFRPVYEYLSAFGYVSIIIFSGANVFFDYAIPESIQPIFGLGWIAMVVGLVMEVMSLGVTNFPRAQISKLKGNI